MTHIKLQRFVCPVGTYLKGVHYGAHENKKACHGDTLVKRRGWYGMIGNDESGSIGFQKLRCVTVTQIEILFVHILYDITGLAVQQFADCCNVIP